MNDMNIATNLLNLEKGVCDLYMHGAVESATDKVRNAFSSGLNENLGMQKCIYETMSSLGMYQMQSVPQQKIDSVKQKFSN
ncbi:MAG: spore coat protein [Ruminococcus sp.]|nr:spore coat protein [Ruminococcus sp.]